MHPSRGGKARHARARKTIPAFLDSSLQPDTAENVTPVQSPTHTTHRTPQTAPQERKSISSKARPLPATEVRKSFSTPSPAASHRKRSRTTDHDDADANQKGGHSLRKRTRIDYSFEYVDDEVGGRSKVQARSASRGRRRRAEDEELEGEAQGQRRSIGGWREGSPRRKNPARKTADLTSYAELADEKDVLDTIEVGGRRGQPHGSPEQAGRGREGSEEEYRERFVVEIPVPASLRGRLGLFTKSPDLIEGSRESSEKRDGEATPAAEHGWGPSEMKTEEVEPVLAAAQPIQVQDEKKDEEVAPAPETVGPVQKSDEGQVEQAEPVSVVVEPTQETDEKKPEQESRSPTPVEPSLAIAIESHSPKDARTASPHKEVESPREQSPSETLASAHERRNSAPGKINPPSIGAESRAANELSGRPWKEFEDLKPEDENGWELMTVGGQHDREAEVVEPVGISSFDGAYSPELEARPAEARPVEPGPKPEPEHKNENDAEPELEKEPEPEAEAEVEPSPSPSPSPAQPLAEPSPVQSPEVDASAETRASSPPETPEKTPEPSPPIARKEAVSVEDQLPRGTQVHTVTIETEEPAPAEARPSTPAKPWSHLTPHLVGQWTMHPESRLPRVDQARASFDSKGSATPSSKPSAANVEAVVNGDGAATSQEAEEEADEPIESVAASPRINVSTAGSPVPELNHATATAASSPAPPDEDEAPDEAEDETPEEPPKTQRFYKYPRLRDPDDYDAVLQHYKDLPTDDLYAMCGFVDETLLALQKEYLMLGAIVDDYDNVERRRAHDEAHEQLERRGDKVGRKTFVLKGYRAAMSAEERETAHARAQDRVQAAAYGFRYDAHQAKVGRQDPVLQGLQNGDEERGPRRTLRSDPLRSAKATEAEEPGKRVRKPREVFDPAAVASRGSTPVGRRRRGRPAGEAEEEPVMNTDGLLLARNGPTPEKPRRGRKRRVDAEAAPVGAQGGMPPPPPPKRVRRASTKALQAAELGEHAAPNTPEVLESVETPRRGQRIVTLKTKAGSFGALARSTESEGASEDSEGWARGRSESEGGEEYEDYEEEPKKRARKVTKRARESGVGNMLLVPSIQDDPFVEVTPGEAKRKPRIKVVKSGGGEAPVPGGGMGVISPTAGANGEEKEVKRKGRKPSLSAAAKQKKLEEAMGDLSAVEYAALSKSEKMSHSMKSRWASGSMQQAVDKRKATLAKKKAAKAVGPGEGSPEAGGEGHPQGQGQGEGVFMAMSL